MKRTKSSISLTSVEALGAYPALAGRSAVAARVPCEDVEIAQAKFRDERFKSAGMFVAAMKEQECLLGSIGRRPVPVEERSAVGTGDGLLAGG